MLIPASDRDGRAADCDVHGMRLRGMFSWTVNEQALVSLKLKKSVDAEGGRTSAVIIEGG